MSTCRPLAFASGFTAAIGGFIQSYAAAAIAGALLFIDKEFALGPFQEGLAASIILLGALVGSLLAGPLADRFGRRPTLHISAFLFIAANFPFLFTDSFLSLLILRFMTGIAAGITSLAVPLYLAEIAPPKLRGAFVSGFQLSVTIGTLTAYFLSFWYAGAGDWRLMLFWTAIPAAIQGAALFFIPETPKWLFGKGRMEKGLNVLKSLHTEMDYPLLEEKTLAASSWNMLFGPCLHMKLLIGISLVVLQQWGGINAITYFAPTIFQTAGFADPKAAIAVTVGLGVVNFIATLISLFLIDRIGRRPLLLFSQTGVAASLVLFTATCIFPGHSSLSVFSLVVYIIFFAVGLGPVPWVLVAEIYPLAIRARAISLMTFLSWLSNFLVVFTFPRLLFSWGSSWTFATYLLISCISVYLFWRIIPETKGKSLEELED